MADGGRRTVMRREDEEEQRPPFLTPSAVRRSLFTELAFHFIELFDVDALLLTEQDHENGETDRRLGRRDRHDEEHVHLPIQVAELARERDEVEVDRKEHQLDAHEQQDHVLAVQENARDAEREQQACQHQYELELDHASFSASILTRRTRSCARTATCAATSCCFAPRRWRIVSVIAATIASSSSTAASSNG